MVKKVFFNSMVNLAKKFNSRAAKKGSSMLMEVGESGGLVTRSITHNGVKRVSLFDSSGNFLGHNIHTKNGTYSTLIGDGYINESIQLGQHSYPRLQRVSLTNGERTTYAEARKFYNDGLEWRGIEGEYDDLVAYVQSTGNGKIAQNSWARGIGLKDFSLQEENTTMGLARARLKATDVPYREYYYSTSLDKQAELDKQIKEGIRHIYNV
ncbi:hypothetical protein IJD34_01195 [bacterium]|nr:hypothetical protein [bacterium]